MSDSLLNGQEDDTLTTVLTPEPLNRSSTIVNELVTESVQLTNGGSTAGHSENCEGSESRGRAIGDEGESLDLENWESPLPFDEYPRPPFPVDCLPAWMADWVRAEAEATQTPPDLAGMLVLSFWGAAVAGRIRVCVRRGWYEPLNLFTLTALPPASRKSAVFQDALKPIQEANRELKKKAGPKIAEHFSRIAGLEARLKDLAKKIAGETDPEKLKALEERRQQSNKEKYELGQPLPEPRLFTDDVSPEKLSSMLAEQGGQMLVAAAESSILQHAMGRYSSKPGSPQAANLDIFLKGHAGDPIRVDRLGRPGESCDRPVLSMALAVQPYVLNDLMENPSLTGRGFLARLLYGLPHNTVGHRKIEPSPVPREVRGEYDTRMKGIWRNCRDMEDVEVTTIRLSPEANRLMAEFEEWLEPQLREDGELWAIAEWAGKLAGALARIAGIFHTASNSPLTEPISKETMASAIHLGREYLIPHAQAAFGIMRANPHTGPARFVVNRMKGNRCSGQITARNLFQLVKGGFIKRMEKLKPVLNLLEEHGYLRQQEALKCGSGRRPSPVLVLNPLYFKPD